MIGSTMLYNDVQGQKNDDNADVLRRLDQKLDLDFHQDNYRNVVPMGLNEIFGYTFLNFPK